MNRNITLPAIIACCIYAGNAFSADWKFYGEFSPSPDREELLYYDAESIINTKNSTKLWVKTVPYGEIKKKLENKAVIDNASKKIATGYKPPITGIYPENTDAAYLEEAVNDATIRSTAEILYQIECSDKKIRKISGTTFNKAGVPAGRLGISKWEDIVPESNAASLAKIVCVPK